MVVLAHGFTQTGNVWGPLADDLAADHEVIALDLPGHGESHAVEADLVAGAELMVEAGGRGTYIGYSMGARYCLHVALAHPEAVTSLVLISGTAGIDDAGERAARRRADEHLADELDPPAGGGPGLPLDVFLDRWLSQPLFAGLDPDAAGAAERRANSPAGLASSLRHAGTGTQRPRWHELDRLTMPVVIVTGERDQKYCDLGRRMARAIGPAARHVVVPGAGHAPHLERPSAVIAAVRAHLGDVPRGSGSGPGSQPPGH